MYYTWWSDGPLTTCDEARLVENRDVCLPHSKNVLHGALDPPPQGTSGILPNILHCSSDIFKSSLKLYNL